MPDQYLLYCPLGYLRRHYILAELFGFNSAYALFDERVHLCPKMYSVSFLDLKVGMLAKSSYLLIFSFTLKLMTMAVADAIRCKQYVAMWCVAITMWRQIAMLCDWVSCCVRRHICREHVPMWVFYSE